MSELLKGSILAQNIQQKVAERVSKLSSPLGLAVILVGDDAASHLYVSLKETAAKKAGIYVEKILLPADTAQNIVAEKIQSLNTRPDIHGILVQLPLPKGLDEISLLASIDPIKDIDGFRTEHLENLEAGKASLVPPVALAVMKLISSTLQPLRNKNALIISNSEIFARPIIALMNEQGIIGTHLSPNTSALENKTLAADILVVAVGKNAFIKENMVSPHAILIDVGTNKTANGLTGDITKSAKAKAAFASPVPGGVGPLTVAFLLLNLLKAAEMQSKAR